MDISNAGVSTTNVWLCICGVCQEVLLNHVKEALQLGHGAGSQLLVVGLAENWEEIMTFLDQLWCQEDNWQTGKDDPEVAVAISLVGVVVFRLCESLSWEDLFHSIDEGSVVNEDVLADTVHWYTTVCDAKILEDWSWLHKWLFTDCVWNARNIEEVASLLSIGGELIVPADDSVLGASTTHCVCLSFDALS